MQRSLLGLLLAVAASSPFPDSARAQSGNATNPLQPARGADPLRPRTQTPRSTPKAAAAPRPGRDDANNLSALRSEDEPSRFAFNHVSEPREARPAARIGGNLDGRGPSGYYGGTKLRAFHPDVRSGTHINANVGETRGHCNPARHQILTAQRPVERPAPPRTASLPTPRPAASQGSSPGD